MIAPPDNNVTAAWLAFLTPVMVAALTLLNLRIAKRQNKTLALAEKTHTLVNSQHGIALATVYEQALRIAKLTGDPVDIEKANIAKKNLNEHEAKQAVVDSREKSGTG